VKVRRGQITTPADRDGGEREHAQNGLCGKAATLAESAPMRFAPVGVTLTVICAKRAR
jgi:hypothetical protein